ncbi:MAG: hypothetical protein FJ264_15540 [Planctomycetes bacterium]|nr:hypothetical protein [Planctomycetota bacterium]
MSNLISFFLGVLSSLFAETVRHKFFFLLFKAMKIMRIESHFYILNEERFQKSYNNVILYDVDEEAFSNIACKFIKERKNTEIFVTNIKEPEWFYSTFSNSISSEKGKNENAKSYLKEFEESVKRNDWHTANNKLESLIQLFYKGNIDDFYVFPHLRSLGNSPVKTVRISFYNLNINDLGSIKVFMERNKKWHVLFFEKFINYNAESWYQKINKYRGTDALILNKKIILNHDDSINELYYQRDSVFYEIKSGYFYKVIDDYVDKDYRYRHTYEIFNAIKNISE